MAVDRPLKALNSRRACYGDLRKSLGLEECGRFHKILEKSTHMWKAMEEWDIEEQSRVFQRSLINIRT